MSGWHNCYATSNSSQLHPWPLELCDLNPEICGQSNSVRRGEKKIWNTSGFSAFFFRRVYVVWFSLTSIWMFTIPIPQWGCPSGSVTGLAWPTSRLCRPLTSETCAAPPRGSRACARRSRSAGARGERSLGCALCSSQSAVKVKYCILILMISKVSCRKGFVSFRKHLEVLGIQESFISGAWGNINCPSCPDHPTLIVSISLLEPAQQQLKWRKISAA